MDLEDLIKGRRHHKRGHHDHYGQEEHHPDHHQDDDYMYARGHRRSQGYPHHGYDKLELIRSLYHSLPHKKALIIGAVVCAVLALIIGVALIWALLPLAVKMLEYVLSVDIQGLLNNAMALLPLLKG